MISDGTSIVQGAAGTANTLLHGNAAGAPTYSAVDLAADVTGILPVLHGGTGAATLTSHGVLLGHGTGVVLATAVGASNTVLHGNTGADPTWSAVVEADISLSNVTTNDATIARHGFLPILSNVATQFLNGQGSFATPAGTGVPYTGATGSVDLNAKDLTNVAHLGVGAVASPNILGRFVGDNGSLSRIAMRGYSSDAAGSAIRVTKFRGTIGAPQAPQSGDSLGRFEFAGYATTSADGLSGAYFESVTTEAWGATAHGTKVLLYVTPNTTTTPVLAATIDQDKKVTLPGAMAVTGHTTFEGVTSTGATGTGKLVYDTSPVFTTPNIGSATGSISGNAGTASAVAVGGITGLGTGVATALAVNTGTTGAFVTWTGSETLTNKTIDAAVAKGTWTASGTWTLPAHTLGGTVSGGGNQINNVIVGASTPLAGHFTTGSFSETVTNAGISTTPTISQDVDGISLTLTTGSTATMSNFTYGFIEIAEVQSVGGIALFAIVGASYIVWQDVTGLYATTSTNLKVSVEIAAGGTITFRNRTAGTVKLKGFIRRISAT